MHGAVGTALAYLYIMFVMIFTLVDEFRPCTMHAVFVSLTFVHTCLHLAMQII